MTEQLVALLEEYRDVLQSLLDLSYEKRQTIIEAKTERLSEIVQAELRVLSEMKSLEKRRLTLVNEIAPEFGVPASELTVSRIADGAEYEQANRLRALLVEMDAIVGSQVQLNSANKELLDAHLEYSEVMLNLMIDSADPLNNFYSEDGSTEGDKKIGIGLFDRQT